MDESARFGSMKPWVVVENGVAAVPVEKIESIIANRVVRANGHMLEQYLVLWKGHETANRRRLSWHSLHELRRALYKVQQYLEQRKSSSRKRKATDDFDSPSGWRESPAERRLFALTRSPSIQSSSSTQSDGFSTTDQQVRRSQAYNGKVTLIGEYDLDITASSDAEILDTTIVPSAAMVVTSQSSSVDQAYKVIRQEFIRRLEHIKGSPVTFVNTVDQTAPSLKFNFIDDYVLGDGVSKVDPGFLVGCAKCSPDMGQGIGCEYTQKCDCLEYAVVDEARLTDKQRALYEQDFTNPGLPKRFPYGSGNTNRGRLIGFYLDKRAPIYECNERCNCGPLCKNRCVQHGRKVKIEIFRTANRGFGLRAKEPLLRGQFIDTYRGEVITGAEADRRSDDAGGGLDSYQYALDKFNSGDTNEPEPYVVDGLTMGGPTRFMNHSCDPNCRQYTVSYNKNDRRIYELAFFACEDIAVDEELTFDYLDKDDEDDEHNDAASTSEMVPLSSQHTDTAKERVECKCGAENCRKWLWV